MSDFVVRTCSQLVDAISSVKGASNLLISLHKALKLSVKVSVLAIKDATVMAEGFNLRVSIIISSGKSLVGESKFFLFTSGNSKVVISISVLAFKVVKIGGEISVTAQFNF